MDDLEMRAYIRECVEDQTPAISAAARSGVEDAFAHLGIDIRTAEGIRRWHDGWAVVRALVSIRNRIGNTIIIIVVTAAIGWAGFKLWPSWWPKNGG